MILDVEESQSRSLDAKKDVTPSHNLSQTILYYVVSDSRNQPNSKLKFYQPGNKLIFSEEKARIMRRRERWLPAAGSIGNRYVLRPEVSVTSVS